MNWVNYLIQVNLFLTVFYGFYWLLLRKETFNTNNRIYLICSVIFSFLIPFWNSELVQSWFITRQTNEIIYSYELSGIIIQSGPAETGGPGILELLEVIYIAGLFFFFAKFLVSIGRLGSLLRSRNPSVKAFSFFNKVFVDGDLKENKTIFEHELVHVKQVHSFDVILFELLGIVCWFNPVVFLFKTSIKNIHEFIADEIASHHLPSKVDYALLLFSQQFQTRPDYLINTFFNRSTLKLRIQMLKKERSAGTALLKYGLVVPLFVSMLVLTSATIARHTTEEAISGFIEVPSSVFPAVTGKSLQKRDITGTVRDESDKPLVGAVIVLVGSNTFAVATDKDGKFTLKDIPANASLMVSHYGYSSQVLQLSDTTPALHFILKKDSNQAAKYIAASQNKTDDHNVTVTSVEQNAEFPGGQAAMHQFISANMRYPASAAKNNTRGKVMIRFLVSNTGKISDIKILQGIGDGCDEEAVRVIAIMPDWIPAVQNGSKVAVLYTMPVSFEISQLSEDTIESPLIIGYSTERKNINSGTGIHYKKNDGYTPVIIRSLNGRAESEPLLIIDEVEQPYYKLKTLNPQDIESISVFKDGEAEKRFGEKGKKGTLVITTKK